MKFVIFKLPINQKADYGLAEIKDSLRETVAIGETVSATVVGTDLIIVCKGYERDIPQELTDAEKSSNLLQQVRGYLP